MDSTTRWMSAVASRPADYPEELPFLPDRGCLLSISGAGASQLFSVMWPASEVWPADLLHQPHNPDPRTAWTRSPDPTRAVSVLFPQARLSDEILADFVRVCESSFEAGWREGRVVFKTLQRLRYPGTVWLSKGSRVRLVTSMAAGATLQEGHPAQQAVRDVGGG